MSIAASSAKKLHVSPLLWNARNFKCKKRERPIQLQSDLTKAAKHKQRVKDLLSKAGSIKISTSMGLSVLCTSCIKKERCLVEAANEIAMLGTLCGSEQLKNENITASCLHKYPI